MSEKYIKNTIEDNSEDSKDDLVSLEEIMRDEQEEHRLKTEITQGMDELQGLENKTDLVDGDDLLEMSKKISQERAAAIGSVIALEHPLLAEKILKSQAVIDLVEKRQ